MPTKRPKPKKRKVTVKKKGWLDEIVGEKVEPKGKKKWKNTTNNGSIVGTKHVDSIKKGKILVPKKKSSSGRHATDYEAQERLVWMTKRIVAGRLTPPEMKHLFKKKFSVTYQQADRYYRRCYAELKGVYTVKDREAIVTAHVHRLLKGAYDAGQNKDFSAMEKLYRQFSELMGLISTGGARMSVSLDQSKNIEVNAESLKLQQLTLSDLERMSDNDLLEHTQGAKLLEQAGETSILGSKEENILRSEPAQDD